MRTTIQDVIDTILQEVPGAPFEESVDTFKAGDPSLEVTGIVTTFLASYEVIQRAVDLGANLIITHEPIYYNHLDEVDWLTNDPVYQAKRQLLEENNVTVDGQSIAGEWIRIHRNTFTAPDVPAIGIRAVPRMSCEIHHNRFFSDEPVKLYNVAIGDDAEGAPDAFGVRDNVTGSDQVPWEFPERE